MYYYYLTQQLQLLFHLCISLILETITRCGARFRSRSISSEIVLSHWARVLHICNVIWWEHKQSTHIRLCLPTSRLCAPMQSTSCFKPLRNSHTPNKHIALCTRVYLSDHIMYRGTGYPTKFNIRNPFFRSYRAHCLRLESIFKWRLPIPIGSMCM